MIATSEEYLTLRLGQDGYGFAQVQAVPELNEETKEVSITFFVDPRNRVYVRRINFNGADNVNDEVFRREMRQLEGSYLSNALVERSQIRLQRLAYIESVEFETVGVPGSPDLVDINFQIEEGLPGQFGGGIGYSEYYGLQLNGNFVHSNFMGTGNRVGVDLSGGEYAKIYSLNTPTRTEPSTNCRERCHSRSGTSGNSRRRRRTSPRRPSPPERTGRIPSRSTSTFVSECPIPKLRW